MAVSTTTWNLNATGDGSTTDFLCAFPLMRLVDLEVSVDDALQAAERDYTVINAVETEGSTISPNFSVRFTTAPASGAKIYIRRRTPRHNSNKLYSGSRFHLPVFENNYDNLVMMFQEIGGLILEGFQGPVSDPFPIGNWTPPTESGFYSAQVSDISNAPEYKIRAVAPTFSGLFNSQLPVLDTAASEINGRSDFSVGDIVLALPITDSNGDAAWRFVGDAACGSSFGGTYYEIERCNDARSTPLSPPVYVRDDEFSPGDVFVRNDVCWKVLATSPASTPATSSVLRTGDVTASTDCTTCNASDVPDPDLPNIPLPGTSFLRMARCEDDSLGEYSMPEEIMGVPVAEDLTKIYSLDCVPYYVTNIREATPTDPLFPVHLADLYNDCASGLAASCGYATRPEMPNLDVAYSIPEGVTATEYGGAAGIALYTKATWEDAFPAFPATEITAAQLAFDDDIALCEWRAGSFPVGAQYHYGAAGGFLMDVTSTVPLLNYRATPAAGDPRWILEILVYPSSIGASRTVLFKKESGCTPAGVYVPDPDDPGGGGDWGYLSGGTVTVSVSP